MDMAIKPERRTIEVDVETRNLLKSAAALRGITMQALLAQLVRRIDDCLPVEQDGANS